MRSPTRCHPSASSRAICHCRRRGCGNWCRTRASNARSRGMTSSRAWNRFKFNTHVQEQAMAVARHPRPKELEGVPLEDIMKKFVGRLKDKKRQWAAFEDAKIEGYKRAQHRFIG